MTRIPVGATIADAYRFAFSDFFKILGLIWLPWAITSLCGYFLLPRLINVLAAIGKMDFPSALNLAWIFIPFLMAGAVLYCSQLASVVELALQPSRQQARYHFSVGRPVWRLIGAFVLALLLYLGAWLASMLASILISLIFSAFATAGNLKIILTLVTASVGTLINGAFICVTVRPVFLLAPIVIAEEKISLGRAWSMGQGNFWRMLLILIATYLPFWLFQRLMVIAFIPSDLVLTAPSSASPAVRAAILANLMDWASKLLEQLMTYWYITYPLGLIWWTIYTGIIFGAQTFAYRALTEGASAPIAAD